MKKALVIIDFQNDFISGSLGFPKAETIRKPIVNKINNALKNNVDLIFTMDTHSSDYLNTFEGQNLPVPHCIQDTWGWELDSSILPFKNQGVVIKKSTFGSLELMKFLTLNGYDEIELCGLVTSICVLTNAVLARTYLPTTKIVVDPNATEDASQKESALACLKAIQVSVS